MIRTALIALVLSLPIMARAQTDPLPEAQPAERPTFVSEDTIAVEDDGGFQMSKSPMGAVLRSAIIPGWGQLYTESYWKVPVVVGVTGFLVYGWISEHNNYAVYRDEYESIKDLDVPSSQITRTKQLREYYRNRRDTYAWWFGVTYLLQIADAFVDAHLYDFDVSDEVQISFHANPGGALGLQVRW